MSSNELDGAAIESANVVAGLDACDFGWAAGLHVVDPRLGDGHAHQAEAHGEDHDGQEEIGKRPGDYHRRPLAHRLPVEVSRIELVAGLERIAVRHAGGVRVALELHVAAERQPADLPARAVPVGDACDFPTEADREGMDLHAVPSCHQEMSELVNEDEDGQDEEEGERIERKARQMVDKGNQH